MGVVALNSLMDTMTGVRVFILST